MSEDACNALVVAKSSRTIDGKPEVSDWYSYRYIWCEGPLNNITEAACLRFNGTFANLGSVQKTSIQPTVSVGQRQEGSSQKSAPPPPSQVSSEKAARKGWCRWNNLVSSDKKLRATCHRYGGRIQELTSPPRSCSANLKLSDCKKTISWNPQSSSLRKYNGL